MTRNQVKKIMRRYYPKPFGDYEIDLFYDMLFDFDYKVAMHNIKSCESIGKFNFTYYSIVNGPVPISAGIH